MSNFARKFKAFLGSRFFFYGVVGFLVLQALWFVFSAVYPMAFDEDFHLGVIQIYAEQWSPFLSAHPAGADQFGAVARDPSYLYHYLMSFPYRLITFFVHDQILQIVILRLMNVALFATGLWLFRKVMLRAKTSAALAHTALALFVLIPIVPQLAAHINYDNLLMVLLPLMCLSVAALLEGFRKQEFDTRALLGFVAICLIMSVVKYASLPFVIGAILCLGVMIGHFFRGSYHKVLPSLRRNFNAISFWPKAALLVLCVSSAVLVAQRYVINTLQYHTPVPNCVQVLTIEQCSAYGPWGRDFWFEQTKDDEFEAVPLTYVKLWFEGMWLRSFFAVNGPASEFTNYRPLPVPSQAAIGILLLGAAAMAVSLRRLFWQQPYLLFLLVISLLYIGILWVDEYGMYRRTGQPVAINGRYLLPILPLVAVILGRALSLLLQRRTYAKAMLASIALLLFLHGGGVMTFILRSDNSWYWPRPVMQNLNNTARQALSPFIIEGPK